MADQSECEELAHPQPAVDGQAPTLPDREAGRAAISDRRLAWRGDPVARLLAARQPQSVAGVRVRHPAGRD